MEINEQFGNASMTVKDNPPYGALINVSFTNYVVVEKMIMYLRINMQQDENDQEYQKEIIKCVADLSKLMRGVNANPILRHVKDDFKQFMDFELEFPMKKVKPVVQPLQLF